MELFKNKSTDLEFKLNLEGNSSLPEARLTLSVNNGASIMLPCRIDESTAKVTIPVLSEILKDVPSSFEAMLEVIVDEGYFVPWRETLTTKSSVTVGVTEATVSSSASKPKMMVEAVEAPAAKKPVSSLPSGSVQQFLKELGIKK